MHHMIIYKLITTSYLQSLYDMVGIFKFGSLQKSFELTTHKPEDQVRSILYLPTSIL